jgi:N-acetylmuramoyl-L-alanine amidase
MYNDKLKVQETISLPNTNKVIIIDAGHGKPDERCRK